MIVLADDLCTIVIGRTIVKLLPVERQQVSCRRALVVEDHPLLARMLLEQLRVLGIEDVKLALTLNDAAALAETDTFNFAILDLNLGDETSLPVANILSEKGIPLIFASGLAIEPELARAYPGSMMLHKPYTLNDLEEALTSHLS